LINGRDISAYLLNPGINVKQFMRRVSNGSLFTLTPTIKYNFIRGSSDAITYKADWQFGIRNNIDRKPWQIEFTGIAKSERDSTGSQDNLDRFRLTGSGGINFVLQEDEMFKSQIELKPYFEYTRVFHHRYATEDVNTYTANITARIRLADDAWLPLTLKLDLKKPQLLGFLTLYWNMK
jgi:hypothetical protein